MINVHCQWKQVDKQNIVWAFWKTLNVELKSKKSEKLCVFGSDTSIVISFVRFVFKICSYETHAL